VLPLGASRDFLYDRTGGAPVPSSREGHKGGDVNVTTPWIAAFAALWLLLVVVAFVLVGTLRGVSASLSEIRDVLLAFSMPEITALAPGEEVEDFEVARLGGGRFTRADLIGRSAVLVFLSGHCAPCRQLAIELRRDAWQAQRAAAELLLVVREPEDVEVLGTPGESEVLIDREGALAQRFASTTTPHAFAVRSAYVVASLVPQRVADLEELARELEEHRVEEVAMA